MSIFRFAGNIAEGMAKSDEAARGRRAKALEAYDAFIKNNPEATKQEIINRRETLGDGSNYLLASLPSDDAIMAQAQRNLQRREIKEQENQAAQLERQVRYEEIVKNRINAEIDNALSVGGTIDQAAIIGRVEKQFESQPVLQKVLQAQYGTADRPKIYSASTGEDGLSRTDSPLSGQIFSRQLLQRKEAQELYNAYGKSMSPEQIKDSTQIPERFKPLVIAIAEERLDAQAYERRLTKADEARKEAASNLAKRKQDYREKSDKINLDIAAQDKQYNRAVAELKRVQSNLEAFRAHRRAEQTHDLAKRTQAWREGTDKRDFGRKVETQDRDFDYKKTTDDRAFDFSKERWEAAQKEVEEKKKIAASIEAKREDLRLRKQALEVAQARQDELAKAAQQNLASIVSGSDLNDAGKDHVRNNLAAIAEIYHIPSTQYAALADIAIKGDVDMPIQEVVNTFESQHGALQKRSVAIQNAASGIYAVPHRMDATIEDGTITAPEGGYTSGVIESTAHVKNELERFKQQAPNETPARVAVAKQHFLKLIKGLQSRIESSYAGGTYGYNSDVINALKAELQTVEEKYNNEILPLTGKAPPDPAQTGTSSPASTKQKLGDAVTVTTRGNRQAIAKINDVNAANDIILRARQLVGSSSGTGQGGRGKLSLEQAIARAAGYNPLTEGNKINALINYARSGDTGTAPD